MIDGHNLQLDFVLSSKRKSGFCFTNNLELVFQTKTMENGIWPRIGAQCQYGLQLSNVSLHQTSSVDTSPHQLQPASANFSQQPPASQQKPVSQQQPGIFSQLSASEQSTQNPCFSVVSRAVGIFEEK